MDERLSRVGQIKIHEAIGEITLATKITIIRILGVPVFVLLLVYYNRMLAQGEPSAAYRYAALSLFLLIAVTDTLDGYLARKRGEVTKLGAILDPLADKALIFSALVMLTRFSPHPEQSFFPVWFAGLVISRDALQVLGALLIQILHGRVDSKTHISGKCATTLLMGSILLVLLRVPQETLNIVLYATSFFILWSGLYYLVFGIQQLEQGN